ncbi:hypothetical protein JWH11_20060 [Xanthomonas melonis]|uniref:Uncharacterized protein n=1 Tax=Xanthomonas melonis TaxID=56456 RepID=A0ABS8P3F7_9XANT|nr:hypothetical protein [Xanthomonas melonis]MCD0260402.1 hypothetical protein [Xanthomonas melonis]MCD0268688.1 hypothetical protein [Xanthomonas melonis]
MRKTLVGRSRVQRRRLHASELPSPYRGAQTRAGEPARRVHNVTGDGSLTPSELPLQRTLGDRSTLLGLE